MTNFTTTVSTALPNAWLWPKQPSRQHFAFVPMREKYTSHARDIFTVDTSTMMVPWLSWKTLAKRYPTMLGYSS
jgi:hypothetical protein